MDGRISVDVCTDASIDGAGFVVEMSVGKRCPRLGQGLALVKEGWLWDRRERLYHTNRRELKAIWKGSQSVAGIMEGLLVDKAESVVAVMEVDLVSQPLH